MGIVSRRSSNIKRKLLFSRPLNVQFVRDTDNTPSVEKCTFSLLHSAYNGKTSKFYVNSQTINLTFSTLQCT